MGDNGKQVVAVKRCNEHMKVEGSVERSMKEGGEAVRVRKCAKCGMNFKTVEETEDQRAYRQVSHQQAVQELNEGLAASRVMIWKVRQIFEMIEKVRLQVEG